jgi:hypothetical protein
MRPDSFKPSTSREATKQLGGAAQGARRETEDHLARVVCGAVHALQAQAAVHARARTPEVLPATREQLVADSTQRGDCAAASSMQGLADT